MVRQSGVKVKSPPHGISLKALPCTLTVSRGRVPRVSVFASFPPKFAGHRMQREGIHKIAKLAGVSIGTVDRALHGRAGISAATRKKVLSIAGRLQYRPNPAARILAVGRPH